MSAAVSIADQARHYNRILTPEQFTLRRTAFFQDFLGLVKLCRRDEACHGDLGFEVVLFSADRVVSPPMQKTLVLGRLHLL